MANNDLDGRIALAHSESGYMNQSLMPQWLEHFESHSKCFQVGERRLLIMDGLDSHFTLEIYEYCQNQNIQLLKLPAHTSQLLQPFDVGCFQSMKHFHSNAIDDSLHVGNAEFDRYDFLESFSRIHKLAFKSSTIKNAFRKAGIVPLNPEKVLQPLRSLGLEPGTPPPVEQDVELFLRTPHRLEQFDAQKTAIWVGIDTLITSASHPQEGDVSAHVQGQLLKQQIGRLLRGVTIQNELQKIKQRQVDNALEAVARKKAQKVMPRTQAARQGIITVNAVRADLERRRELECVKAANRRKRTLKRASQRRITPHTQGADEEFIEPDVELEGSVEQWESEEADNADDALCI